MGGHIPFSKIDLWLRGWRSIWISTTRKDGRPHAVPVWYIWDGRHIYFSADPNSQKGKNLARTPYAVIHGGDGDDTVILEGPVSIVTDPGERAVVDKAYSAKYVDPHSGMTASVADPAITIYRVNVCHMMVWEYGVYATRTDWHFEPQT